MRAAIYARVSTKDQSVDLQVSALTDYCAARGWTYQVFSEHITGTKAKRPELQRVLELVKSGQVDVVVCYKLDRFARSLTDLLSLLHDITSRGVSFVCVRDNIDLTTPAGRLMVHLLGAFAEFEASLIRERVTAGVRASIKKRGNWGRKTTVPAAKVLELRKKGVEPGEIAKTLKISRSSVFNVLKRA